MDFLRASVEAELYLSVLSLGEIKKGIEKLIASTALVIGLTLVTRSVDDFAVAPVDLENPWT